MLKVIVYDSLQNYIKKITQQTFASKNFVEWKIICKFAVNRIMKKQKN